MDTHLKKMADIAKAASDPTRLGILTLLAKQGEVCVCDIAGLLGEPDFKVSRHLAILRKSGLVEARREQVWMHYSLATPQDELEQALLAFIRTAANQISDYVKGSGPVCCAPKKRVEE